MKRGDLITVQSSYGHENQQLHWLFSQKSHVGIERQHQEVLVKIWQPKQLSGSVIRVETAVLSVCFASLKRASLVTEKVFLYPTSSSDHVFS